MEFTPKKYNDEQFYFKIEQLKYFWKLRDRNLIPANGKGFAIKMQKFLFFYNAFCKFEGKDYTLDRLKAFREGPVFNDIYYEHKNKAINNNLTDITIPNTFTKKKIDIQIINLTSLLLASIDSGQISYLTHSFDCWKKTYNNVTYNNKFLNSSNDISENSFTNKDIKMLDNLLKYLGEMDRDRKLYRSKNNILAIKKDSYDVLVNNYSNDLNLIQEKYNPVFVEFDIESNEVIYDY